MVMQRKEKKPDDGTEAAVPVAAAPSPEMSDCEPACNFDPLPGVIGIQF